MHIVRNGIDIPDELVRAHEEGRVVFFCGSGISYEAGLSDFKTLTHDVFRRVAMSLALLHLSEFPDSEMEPIIRSMKVSQLEDAAQVIESHMRSVAKGEGDVDKAWREGCWPIICGMWPQDAKMFTDKIQDFLTLALLNTSSVLSEGLGALWFLRFCSNDGGLLDGKRNDCHWFLHECSKSKNIDRFPREVLEIIWRRTKGVRLWTVEGLDECLSRMAKADVNIVNDKRFIDLKQKVDYVKEQLC